MAQFNFSAAEQIEYDALVKAEYRSGGWLLKDACRRKENVVGASVQFRKMGYVTSVPTGYAQAVTPQDPGISIPTANLVKHTTPILVDDVQELTVNFDAKMESVREIGAAMGRRSDQIQINALAADAGTTITAGGVGMNYQKYTEVIEHFENNGVPLGNRFIAITGQMFRQLLAEDEFTSTFYTANRVLDKGMLREYLGLNVIVIPSMEEGGLPIDNGTRSAFAWHTMALGFGVGANFRAEVNYSEFLTSWLANGVFSAGAVVIDNRGVIQIDCVES